jgi:hypothetical protein
VTAVNPGWVNRGVAMQPGDSAEVTEAQAKRLKEKGLIDA